MSRLTGSCRLARVVDSPELRDLRAHAAPGWNVAQPERTAATVKETIRLMQQIDEILLSWPWEGLSQCAERTGAPTRRR